MQRCHNEFPLCNETKHTDLCCIQCNEYLKTKMSKIKLGNSSIYNGSLYPFLSHSLPSLCVCLFVYLPIILFVCCFSVCLCFGINGKFRYSADTSYSYMKTVVFGELMIPDLCVFPVMTRKFKNRT